MHRRRTHSLLASTLLAACPFAPGLAAQSLPEGYASHLEALPNGSGNTLLLQDGLVWFTGTDLVLRERGQTRTLLHFPQSVFGSFTIALAPDTLLFGESSAGDLWLVPLRGPQAPRVIANVPFNFDALHYAPSLVLVSAKTGGFAASRNDVVAVDLQAGTVVPLISVPGASGPLEQDAAGNLYYATGSNAFPPPAGATDVLRWDGTRLFASLGTRVLTEADATVLHRGLDAAGDIAFDGDGDLFFVDWSNETVAELNDLGSGTPATVLVDFTGLAEQPATLQFVARAGPGDFEPFQPTAGGSLAVLETSFGATSRLRLLTPRRPRARAGVPGPIPAGAFQVAVEDGPPGGTGLLAVNGFFAGRETPLTVPGFEQRLLWDLGMFGALNTHILAFDGGGRSTVSLRNPGFPGGLQVAVQAAFLDGAGRVLGSSPVTALSLGQ